MRKKLKADVEWQNELSTEAYQVLRQEATEPAASSPLIKENRAGTYVCAGCGQELFKSDGKYDSSSGWPSFFVSIVGALETKPDNKLAMPRTEYHCSNCGGHQGHVFDDGSAQTGKRYCNNGLALKFIADE